MPPLHYSATLSLPIPLHHDQLDLDEHQYGEDGEHEEAWELYMETIHTKLCENCCGECCEQFIVEASFRDAEREPRIKDLPTIKGFTDEVEGYLLNGEDGACVFFNQETALCTIYETRPLVCRVFDCDCSDPKGRDSDDVQFK